MAGRHGSRSARRRGGQRPDRPQQIAARQIVAGLGGRSGDGPIKRTSGGKSSLSLQWPVELYGPAEHATRVASLRAEPLVCLQTRARTGAVQTWPANTRRLCGPAPRHQPRPAHERSGVHRNINNRCWPANRAHRARPLRPAFPATGENRIRGPHPATATPCARHPQTSAGRPGNRQSFRAITTLLDRMRRCS